MTILQALALGSAWLLLVFTPSAAAAYSCLYPNHTAAGGYLKGITWDLTNAAVPNGTWYGAHDGDIMDVENFYFTFNICGAMTSYPTNCTAANSDCTSPDAPSAAAAWRYDSKSGKCYCLGTFPYNPSKVRTYHVDIHDLTRPALGVNLLYKLGGSQNIDKCVKNTNGPSGFTPNVTITLYCGNPRHHSTDKLVANATQKLFIDATDECGYDIHAVSTMGCPKECPVSSNDQVCSGNGHCAYDFTSQRAHCFCDKNYSGNDCSKKVTDSHSSAAAVGAVFGGIFTGLFAIAGFWYYKHRWVSGASSYQNKDGEEGFY
eukprot:gb/GECG01006599.1/.p1 GENE.gb/GECG01006599.1/~~gb/GECG01006599.1/.p1  ORF type:complete len:317 (+),score=15.12 gb/GECG01006599.1/:1-951(+)